jgi:hypothetical protein
MKAILAIFIGLGLLLTSIGCSRNDTKIVEYIQTVNADTFVRLKQLMPPKDGESNQQLLNRYLDEHGVKVKSGIILDEKMGLLRIFATSADQDKIAFYIFPLIKHN